MKLEVTIVPSASFGVFLFQSLAGVEVDTSGTLDLKRALKPLSTRASGVPSHGIAWFASHQEDSCTAASAQATQGTVGHSSVFGTMKQQTGKEQLTHHRVFATNADTIDCLHYDKHQEEAIDGGGVRGCQQHGACSHSTVESACWSWLLCSRCSLPTTAKN